MIVFGTRLFGKSEVVPGVGHVATRFLHIWYVPLVPTGTYFVDAWGNGLPIRFSFRSLCFAWGRVALIIATFAAIVTFATHAGLDGISPASVGLAVSALSFVALFFFSYRMVRLSPENVTRWEALGVPAPAVAHARSVLAEVARA